MRTRAWTAGVALVLFGLASAAAAGAQERVLRIVGDDGRPVPFAYVAIEGSSTRISDEAGTVSLGAGKRQTLSVLVRRIGYTPFYGKMEFPDTVAMLTVTLERAAHSLSAIVVKDTLIRTPLQLSGFYKRWLAKQRGALRADFIGPEELDFRHPDRITNVLQGLSGVAVHGDHAAWSSSARCPMAVVLDGVRICPQGGCASDDAQVSMLNSLGRNRPVPVVSLDELVDAHSVAAIEVYARGGNIPQEMQQSDWRCGVIAIWTGARR